MQQQAASIVAGCAHEWHDKWRSRAIDLLTVTALHWKINGRSNELTVGCCVMLTVFHLGNTPLFSSKGKELLYLSGAHVWGEFQINFFDPQEMKIPTSKANIYQQKCMHIGYDFSISLFKLKMTPGVLGDLLYENLLSKIFLENFLKSTIKIKGLLWFYHLIIKNAAVREHQSKDRCRSMNLTKENGEIGNFFFLFYKRPL